MSVWEVVAAASIACVAFKVGGYLVPARAFDAPPISRTMNLVTVALLAGLITVQTLGTESGIAVDARMIALVLAAGLYAVKTPFMVVVIASVAAAALLRAGGQHVGIPF